MRKKLNQKLMMVLTYGERVLRNAWQKYGQDALQLDFKQNKINVTVFENWICQFSDSA